MGLNKKKVNVIGRSLTVLGFYYFGADSISKEVVGFSPFMASQGKTLCSLSLVFDCCACYSLS